MKTNDSDNGLKIKKKKNSNLSFILRIIVIIFVIFIVFYLFFFISNINSDDSYEIDRNGERYGTSEFIKYDGKVYVFVWGDGIQVINDVDIKTFRPLNSEDFYSGVVGLDKNHVYFGNIPIPNLNPDTFYSIGNSYYSDGTTTYFCSPISERDKNLSAISEIFQVIIYSFFKSKKPQIYTYPYKKIETNKKLEAIGNLYLFATDGEQVYYKGEVLKNADLKTLKLIDKDTEYFADKENVYYKSKLLPIKNTGELKVVSTKHGDKFLYDEKNGDVFFEDYSFDREKSPYKVLGNRGDHLYDLFFVARDGIYFYNTQKKEAIRIGENIFSGNIEEITPDIFMDNKDIYYFDTYDVWFKRKNTGDILISKNTVIYFFDKKDSWEKVTDINDGTVVGAIWKKENKYYYFDNAGIHQLIYHPIYEILDKETLNYLLLSSKSNTVNFEEEIRKLIKDNKLIEVKGKEKIRATAEIKNIYRNIIKYLKIFFFVLIVIIGIFKLYKNIKGKKEEDNKNKWGEFLDH